jgi:3alpha(or 20beta)-hydroxysteroid dehydrogenase
VGVLITGGSRGIGRAVVRAFSAAGERVVFSYSRDQDGADATVAESPTAIAVRMDLRDPGSSKLSATAFELLGSINVLVNCAGIYPHATFRDVSTEEVTDVMHVNYVAPFAMMREVSKLMAVSGGGAIVNVTSINAFAPESGLAAYDASKAALAQLTRTAAVELGPLNIRVNAVAPGLVDAPGIELDVPLRVRAFLAHAPLGRLVRADDVASAVHFLSSPSSSAITGQTLVVDCGVSLSGYTAAF